MLKEAQFYEKSINNKIKCGLCPHNCIISEGQKGKCAVRINQLGILNTLNYGEVSSMSLDPIEKKPLYQYKPGSKILSIGSFGCNFSCAFCQNYRISKGEPNTQFVSTEDLIKKAIMLKEIGNIGVAFTYNEPSIWFEYVIEAAEKLRKDNLEVVVVTNGFISALPLMKLSPYINAVNIDLKAFKESFYRDICKGVLSPVKQTIELMAEHCHIEITTLVIEGYNDNLNEIEALSAWVSEIDPKIPLHLSAYHPAYRFDAPATSLATLIKCKEAANKNLKYVYIGNVYGVDNNTYCDNCGEKLIDRENSKIEVLLKQNKCPKCDNRINIVL